MNEHDPRLHDEIAMRIRLSDIERNHDGPRPIPPEAWIIAGVVAIAFIVAILTVVDAMSAI